LVKADLNKQHARQVAINNIQQQVVDEPLIAPRVQKSQGQGDSAPRDLDTFKINPDQLNDEDFDFKGTSRKEYENEFYKRVCSEVIDGFMWLGSDLVARDEAMLTKIGITHVVNCAADYSENYFESSGVKYKSYHLKDHVREDISCVFYDAINFIAEARSQGGKVYVHCVQGISRSATIILAYKIFSEKCTY
jgi:predicted secreted protein